MRKSVSPSHFSKLTPSFRTFASSAPSGIVPQLMEEFGFSAEVGALTIALFVVSRTVSLGNFLALIIGFRRDTV